MSDNFEDITHNGTLIKAAKMTIGGNFQGKLVALEANQKYPDKQNLVMEDADGNPFVVFASGTLAYAIKDGKFEVGRTYRVTRLENKPTPNGASRTQFKIERLKADGSAAGAPTVNNAKPAGRGAAASKGNGTSKQA